MADIHIHRAHSLGLPKARKVAAQWAKEAESRLGVECTTRAGDDEDVVEFSRPGVDGRLVVRADSFDARVELGFLLGAFRSKIEAGIEENFDALLAVAEPAPTKKTPSKAAKKAAKKAAR